MRGVSFFLWFLCVAGIVGIMFMAIYAVPRVRERVEAAGVELPVPTENVFQASQFAKTHWFWVSPIVGALIGALIVFEFAVKNKRATIATYVVLLLGLACVMAYMVLALVLALRGPPG